MKQIAKRTIIALPAVVVQVLWYYILIRWLTPWATYINMALSVLSIIIILYIITKHDDATYKILWLLIILSFPILGVLLYLMFGNKRTTRSLRKKLETSQKQLYKDTESIHSVEIPVKRVNQTFQYISNMTKFPVRINKDAKYYSLGDEMYPEMLEDLQSAKRYIYMEYFIIANGKMWDSFEKILEEKVKLGVDVRVMFDDIGSISTISLDDVKRLEGKGIKCAIFNPVKMISGTLNYRDHRKMMIIDGQIAYSGGINLADEYINDIVKYGHWKDIGYRVTGGVVNDFIRMFVEFWDAFAKGKIPKKIYEKEAYFDKDTITSKDGYVLTYYDSPIRSDNVSNELYVELLSQAEESAYFFTPYLMLGDTLLEAFERAAKRGVDVRIIMPRIPDKKLIFSMSRSFYPPLIQSGVKIYEYVPGFVHAKASVIDGKIGTIGTVNLDYRSLFLHFENNAFFYQADILKDIQKDFLATQEKSEEMVIGQNLKITFTRWFFGGILRIFSPLC